MSVLRLIPKRKQKEKKRFGSIGRSIICFYAFWNFLSRESLKTMGYNTLMASPVHAVATRK
jgi:hypothetical protein